MAAHLTICVRVSLSAAGTKALGIVAAGKLAVEVYVVGTNAVDVVFFVVVVFFGVTILTGGAENPRRTSSVSI
jgi:hypothetical protein